jgi:hypothetical protein
MAPDRQLLRHAVATLAYRAGKAVRDAPVHVADFTVAAGTRTPAQILATGTLGTAQAAPRVEFD